MSQAIASKSQIKIRGICPPGLILILKIGLNFIPARFDERANCVPRNGRHRDQSFRARSTQQIQQKSLHPVVSRMRQGDLCESMPVCNFAKELPPRLPPRRFQIRLSSWGEAAGFV